MSLYNPADPVTSVVLAIVLLLLGILIAASAETMRRKMVPIWLGTMAFGALIGLAGIIMLLQLNGTI